MYNGSTRLLDQFIAHISVERGLARATVADTSSLTACCARANRWTSWMLASLLALLRVLSPSESSCATYSSMSALPMASGSVMPRVCASHER